MKKFCHAYDNSVCKVPNSSFVKGKLQFGWGKTESDEGACSPVLCRARAKKTFLPRHDRPGGGYSKEKLRSPIITPSEKR